MEISFYGKSDTGMVRDHNEDSYIICCQLEKTWQVVNELELNISDTPGIFLVVADGMGGQNAGEVASDIAVNTVLHEIRTISESPDNTEQAGKILTSIIQTAHQNIVKEAKSNLEMKGMGTTIVLVWIVENMLYVAWSGDSRCYRYNKHRDNQLLPFTDDHSLVWSRVESGDITPEDARLSKDSNLILQALGDPAKKPAPDFRWINLEVNDRILLCSDGLNSMLSEVGIQQILDLDKSPKETCENLVKAANNAGGTDNITTILLDIKDIQPLTQREQIRKPGKRKRIITGLLILLAAIIIAGLFYRERVVGYFRQITNSNSDSLRTNKETSTLDLNQDITSEAGTKPIDTPEITSVPGTVDTIESTMDIDKPKPVESSISVNENIIQEELGSAIVRIDQMKKSIEDIGPGSEGYRPEYYQKNEERFESIIHQLDSILLKIRSVSTLRGDNLVEITDPIAAKELVSPIRETLDSLENITNQLLLNPIKIPN